MALAPAPPHGEPIVGRTVSFLELFYDLVYVAVVSQAAHHLAEHVSLRGVGEFAVVFALIWLGWINGTLYLELHGREDGRTRTVVFVQMGVLVILAVYTAEAAGERWPWLCARLRRVPGPADVVVVRGTVERIVTTTPSS